MLTRQEPAKWRWHYAPLPAQIIDCNCTCPHMDSREDTKKQARAGSVPPAERSYSKEISEILSFFKTLALFLVVALFLRASVVEAFKIPSGSMIPTLRIGDHILVSKFTYGLRLPFLDNMIYQYSTPERGDIVVFTRPDDPLTPEDDSKINIIKRVIGLPGDSVEVIGTKVYINNQEYPESYARWDEGGNSNWGPETIPQGALLMMGDNRDHSKDSRFWGDPFLPVERVKGRALLIYWTWDSDFLGRIGKVIR